MPARTQPFVALLRGINVGGANKLPMARLRALCEAAGCDDVRTYIQSGNVVFTVAASARALETRLEDAIDRECGISIPVIVRSASAWRGHVAENPFPDESEREAKWVALCLAKQRPKAGAAAALERHATQGERVLQRGHALWIHYPNGIARSKLTPAVLDRHAGSPVTARNWRTVTKLDEMLREAAG